MLVELAHVAIIAACLAVAVFYGRYMARVFNGDSNLLTPIIRPVEKIIYRLCGIDEQREMSWKNYLLMLICFEVLGIAFFFMLLMLQGVLPLNPQGLGSFRWDTALNTAFSFVTNTEWQVYSGERDMSYLSQILGVIVQDFLSPAVGLACSVALIRGFVRKNFDTIGNFWVDVTRIVFYIILPLALILAFAIASQGVIQNMNPYVTAKTLEGAEQLIPGGPAAGLIAMQIVCEDGGGFFERDGIGHCDIEHLSARQVKGHHVDRSRRNVFDMHIVESALLEPSRNEELRDGGLSQLPAERRVISGTEDGHRTYDRRMKAATSRHFKRGDLPKPLRVAIRLDRLGARCFRNRCSGRREKSIHRRRAAIECPLHSVRAGDLPDIPRSNDVDLSQVLAGLVRIH